MTSARCDFGVGSPTGPLDLMSRAVAPRGPLRPDLSSVPDPQPRPTPVEVATGVVVGHTDPSPEATIDVGAASRSGADPLAALERAVLPALRRPPCVVSFSGGMDSSFVLAVAVRLARRERLPAPIPVTWRFTGAPRAEESRWQERIMRALGVAQWTVLQARDDLDLVGPVARRVLLRHGILHPANVHLHLPIAQAAAGGSLLTGAGGDQIFAGWRRHPGKRSCRTPQPLLVRRPRWPLSRQRAPDPFPWLHPAVSRDVRREYRAERAAEPRAASARVRWHAGRRDLAMACAALSAAASDSDVAVVNPLLDHGFVAALSAYLGAGESPSRADLLTRVAGGTLPPVITAPRPKARFLDVFLRAPTRAFTSGWDGSGLDEDLVDVTSLRALWSRWPIPPGTAGLVQQAWLAASRPQPTSPPTFPTGRPR
ncbi:MAG: asparagine synthase-related protein [Frankia sp.]